MSNDLKSSGEHAGGANNDFQKFASGDNADKVLSASYQNKLIAGVERANRGTFGSGVVDFGPVSLQKGQRRAPESGNRIRVRLDYPYRAPMGAVVGIDFPILDEAIEDQYDLVNFLNDPVTTYSCSKNQYRHHNRIAILEQELLPGQAGWAVISGLAKTFWHAQRPPDSGSNALIDDTRYNTPPQDSSCPMDEYKQLGILSAIYDAPAYSRSWGSAGSEHGYVSYDDTFIWLNRQRPYWLAPIPRKLGSGDELISEEIAYPYASEIASNRGRVTGLLSHVVPESACTGSSVVRCVGNQLRVVSSTCSPSCSSWPIIGNAFSSQYSGLPVDGTCTNGDEYTVDCVSEYPINDAYDDGSFDSEAAIIQRSSVGDWAGIQYSNTTILQGIVGEWISGTVILGTPEAPPIVDTTGPDRNTRADYKSPVSFPSPYSHISNSDFGTVLSACNNVTCTYTCNGTSWERARGDTPYNLDRHWRCRCPDDWMELMAQHDLPCNAMSQPREFTVGMIFDSVQTTTSTTTTSSSTTTTCASSNSCGLMCVDFIPDGVRVAYAWTMIGCDNLNDCACAYGGDDAELRGYYYLDGRSSTHEFRCTPSDPPVKQNPIACGDPPPVTGACCGLHDSCTTCLVLTEDNCTFLGGSYQGDNTTCSSCPTQDVGACCYSVDSVSTCDSKTECGCDNVGGTFLGAGITCFDRDTGAYNCNSTTTTTSSTTTTTSPPTTTTTTTTTSSTTTTSDTTTTTTSSTTTTTEIPTTTTSTTTTTSDTSTTTSSTTTTTEGSSSTTTSSTTTTTEGSSSTTSSTTTTSIFCTGTCDWLCVDSAWQLSVSNCGGGEACNCYSFDLESCSGTGATTSNNCRVI